jgi:hypothetical protein
MDKLQLPPERIPRNTVTLLKQGGALDHDIMIKYNLTSTISPCNHGSGPPPISIPQYQKRDRFHCPLVSHYILPLYFYMQTVCNFHFFGLITTLRSGNINLVLVFKIEFDRLRIMDFWQVQIYHSFISFLI